MVELPALRVGEGWDTHQLVAGRPLVLRSPDAVRPWQHVLEPLSGYLTLAQHLAAQPAAYAEGWNFGPTDDDLWPVRRVVQSLLGELHSRLDERGLMTTVPGELLFAVGSDEVQPSAYDTLFKIAELIGQ